MRTRTIRVQLEVPDGVSDGTRETAERKAREVIVLTLWEAGEISTREAAAELGLAYHEFLDLLTQKGIPVESGMFDAGAVEAAARQFAGEKP